MHLSLSLNIPSLITILEADNLVDTPTWQTALIWNLCTLGYFPIFLRFDGCLYASLKYFQMVITPYKTAGSMPEDPGTTLGYYSCSSMQQPCSSSTLPLSLSLLSASEVMKWEKSLLGVVES